MVSLYKDNQCNTAPLTSATVGKQTNQDEEHFALLSLTTLNDGFHVFYARAQNSFDKSLCSKISLSYIVETVPPQAPSGFDLVNPVSSPSFITTPSFRVKGVKSGNLVSLYTDSACNEANKRAESLMDLNPSVNSILLKSNSLNSQSTKILKTYSFYAKAENSKGSSPCSTVKFDYTLDQIPPTAPLNLTLINPSTGNRDDNSTPTIRVSGVSVDHKVNLYTDPNCSDGFLRGSGKATSTSINITTSQLPVGSYVFYAKTFDVAGNPSTCSTASVEYIRDRGQTPTAPTSLSLQDPKTSPGEDQTPTIRVNGVSDVGMDKISLHTESTCSDNSQVAEGLVSMNETNIDLTPTKKLLPGQYTFYAKASNSSGASSCSTASVAYKLDPDLYNKTPVGEIDISGFWVNARALSYDKSCAKSVASTYLYKKDSFGYKDKTDFSEKNKDTQSQCFIDVNTPKASIVCFMDIPEGILFTHNLQFQYNLPPKVCSFFEQEVPWHWNVESGIGPTEVELKIDVSSTDEKTVTSCKAKHKDHTNLINCTHDDFNNELSFISSSSDYINGPKCNYDRTFTGNENCCFGEYTFTKITQKYKSENGSEVKDGLPVSESERRDWGGKPENCIGGPGRKTYAWPHYLNDYPVKTLQDIKTDNETGEPKGLNDVYTVPNPFDRYNNYSFSIAANYFTHYHSSKENTLPPSTIPLETSIPTANPGTGTGKNPHPLHNPLDLNPNLITKKFYYPMAIYPKDRSGDNLRQGNMYYNFQCLDKAREAKYEIKIMIREWNTKEDFESYKKSYVEYIEELNNTAIQNKTKKLSYLPDVLGSEGESRTTTWPGRNCASDGGVIFLNDCNDSLDFDDLAKIPTKQFPYYPYQSSSTNNSCQ